MKTEDSSRYLSPLVKQDLAKLDTDGDTRRLAVKSLKLFVEQLDASTLPRFISQIAESREPGATRSYAISLFEEVARVHGKLVVPHIPRIMGSIVRSSSASGSFPQLQVASARVTAALARHCIDSSTSQADSEEIVREICSSLIDCLSGKLEPVAATAAACIHALAETDKWKYASEEIVQEVCQRTIVALGERSSRSGAHMQLVRILASVNPDTISIHGANLLRAGEEILKVTANPWQIRKAAAQMLQSVLTILDKETLEIELNAALNALDSCRLDKMPHVRVAVSEALHIAKMLAPGNNTTHTSFGMAASPVRRSADHSDWSFSFHENVPISPVSKRGTSPRAPMSPDRVVPQSPTPKRGASSRVPIIPNKGIMSSPRTASSGSVAGSPTSQESRHLSYSPVLTSSDFAQVPSPTRSQGRSKVQRTPLYPTRGMAHAHPPRSVASSPSSSVTTVEECESPSRRLNLEFYVRPRSRRADGVDPEEIDIGYADDYCRPRAPVTSGPHYPLLPTQLDLVGSQVQKLKEEQEWKDVGTNTPRATEHLREASNECTATASSEVDSELSASMSSSPKSEGGFILPMLKMVGGTNSLDQQSKLRDAVESRTSMQRDSRNNLHITLPTDDDARGEDENVVNTPSADIEVEKRELFISKTPKRAQNSTLAGSEVDTGNQNGEIEYATHEKPNSLKYRFSGLAHLNVNSENKTTESVNMAKNFLPLVTPKRLVRSLSSLSAPDLRGSLHEYDMKFSQSDAISSVRMLSNNANASELDGEASSETGWSVRDNPIASEDSYRVESSDEETTGLRREPCGSFPRLRELAWAADRCSPREIHMVFPASETPNAVEDGASLDHMNRLNSSDQTCTPMTDDDAETESTPSAASGRQSFSSCKLRVSAQATEDMGSDTNLSSDLDHEDQKKPQPYEGKLGGHYNNGAAAAAMEEDEDEEFMCRNNPAMETAAEQRRSYEKDGSCCVIKAVTHNWKRLCSHAESVLGGSLCFAVALPLAIMACRTLNGTRDLHHLVPT